MRGEDRVFPWLVTEVDGAIVAYAYAGTHRARAAYRWTVETSIYSGPAHVRRGMGRALYAALFAELVGLGYREAVAGITLPNEASVRFHEALGFGPIGVFPRVGYKLGAWFDVGFWQRSLASGDGAPPEPVSLPPFDAA